MVISELMLFSERMVLARKKRKVSQEELAKRLGVHAPIIGRYEQGEVKPSMNVAAKIAEALEISLDYLCGFSNTELDKQLINQINDLQDLSSEDQNHILKTLQSIVRDANARAAYG